MDVEAGVGAGVDVEDAVPAGSSIQLEHHADRVLGFLLNFAAELVGDARNVEASAPLDTVDCAAHF